MPGMQPKRCSWVNVDDTLMREYHDREWGVPTHDDRTHFEFLILEAAQAGLSWSIVLDKHAVKNARAFLGVQNEFGSFDAYCWQFVDGRPRHNRWKSLRQIPATTVESDAFSRDLKHRGFSFVGSTVIYAHMQAVGMANDHVVDCYRYRDVRRLGTPR
jgi:DNA-3-methyladenine glycosylase I